MATVTELVTKFTFAGSTSPLDSFNTGMGDALGFIAKGVAGFAALGTAISVFTVKTLGGLDAIAQMSKVSNISVEAIQELGFAASVSGSSVAAMESTISSLSAKIGDAAQKGSADFARLGISVRNANGEVKTADVILYEVSQRFNQLGLSMQEQQSFASSLGIDPSLVQLLGKTSGELAGLRKQARDLGVVTSAQSDEIISFNDSITTLKFGLGAVQNQLAIGLAPALQDTTGFFTDLLTSNKDFISGGIEVTIKWIGFLFDAFERLLPVIGLITAGFVLAKIAALGFSGVMSIILSPIVLVTAAIISSLLVIDDLIAAFKGGKSVIADFSNEFFGWDIAAAMHQYVADVKLFIDDMTMFFGEFFDFIGSGFDSISNFVGKIGGFLGIGDDADTKIRPGQGSSQTSITNNNITLEQRNEIKTNDPEAAGRAVTNSLQDQLSNADIQINQGGR